MEKLKAFFHSVAEYFKHNSKSRNLAVLVGELVIFALAGSIAAVAILSSPASVTSSAVTTSSKASSQVSSAASSSASVASGSSTASVAPTTSTVQQAVQVDGGTTTVNSNVAGTKDVTVNVQVPNTSSTVATATYNYSNYMVWSNNQFLPSLNPTASVLDYYNSVNMTAAEQMTFTSLQGIVNKRQPRIYNAQGDPTYDGNFAQNYGLKLEKNPSSDGKLDNDPYQLILKYRKEISGIIIYDDGSSEPAIADEVNLATTMCGPYHAIACNQDMATKLENAPYNLPVVQDLRTKGFQSKWDIYLYEYQYFANLCTNRVIFSLAPSNVNFARDYAIAVGAPVIYLDPTQDSGDLASNDAMIMGLYFSRMVPGRGIVMGWWMDEPSGVHFAAQYGVTTVASDFSADLSVFSGMQQSVTPQADAPKLTLKNKVYVALIMSDGDNEQYCQGRMRDLWMNDPNLGKVPVAWTATPSLLDLNKPMLNYYLNKEKTDQNDFLIDGPSAYGYTYPWVWQNLGFTDAFASNLKLANTYFSKIGMRTITIWNNGGDDAYYDGYNNDSILKVYADNCPYLYGVSQQEPMDKFVKMVNSHFLATNLNGAYNGSFGEMTTGEDAVNTYNGSKPVFVAIQFTPWGNMGILSNVVRSAEAYESMNPNVEVIRYDQWMQLQMQYLNSQK